MLSPFIFEGMHLACRGAPLSEGRRKADGALSCSYHGWQWNGSGSCTRIPQITNTEHHQRSTSAPKACLRTLPVKAGPCLCHVTSPHFLYGSSKLNLLSMIKMPFE